MSDSTVSIKCKKCGHVFQPDVKTKRPWFCPSCKTKNPNLRRHYRSVADVFILGFIFTVVVASIGFNQRGVDLGLILSAGHAILLLVTIIVIFKSKAPWMDTIAKRLIWIVFGLALLFNVLMPLLFAGMLNPGVIVYAAVFSYLFWLNGQANRCTAPEPPPVPVQEQS